MSLSLVPLASKLGHQWNDGPFEHDLPRPETDDLIGARREWNDLCVLMTLENEPLVYCCP